MQQRSAIECDGRVAAFLDAGDQALHRGQAGGDDDLTIQQDHVAGTEAARILTRNRHADATEAVHSKRSTLPSACRRARVRRLIQQLKHTAIGV